MVKTKTEFLKTGYITKYEDKESMPCVICYERYKINERTLLLYSVYKLFGQY